MNAHLLRGALIVTMCLLATGPALAQRGHGRGPMGRGPAGHGPAGDARFAEDRELFHELLAHRDAIRRTVTKTEHGVETLTESDDPAVAAAIQRHVASMKERVEQQRPIHLRDPLFAAVFRHADKIKFEYVVTERGLRVTETSDDPYVVQLIQAHADVVSLFLKNGFPEVRQSHDVPVRPKE